MNINFEIPDECFDRDNKLTEYDVKMLITNKLYEEGIIGTSLAAEIVGIDRAEYMSEMGKYGVGIYWMSEEDLKEEIENANKM